MENGIKIDNEIANYIIKLCMTINDLKKDDRPNSKKGLLVFTTYDEIKNRMDEILKAPSMRAMSSKIIKAQAFTKYSLKAYKMLPRDFKGRNQSIAVLDIIFKQLSELDKHLYK